MIPQDPEKGISGLFLDRKKLKSEKEIEDKILGHRFLEKRMV